MNDINIFISLLLISKIRYLKINWRLINYTHFWLKLLELLDFIAYCISNSPCYETIKITFKLN